MKNKHTKALARANGLKPWASTPKITEADISRLEQINATTNSVLAYFASGDANIKDLKKLIIMEFTVRKWKRDYVSSRLFAHLAKLQRYEAERVLGESYYVRTGFRA